MSSLNKGRDNLGSHTISENHEMSPRIIGYQTSGLAVCMWIWGFSTNSEIESQWLNSHFLSLVAELTRLAAGWMFYHHTTS